MLNSVCMHASRKYRCTMITMSIFLFYIYVTICIYIQVISILNLISSHNVLLVRIILAMHV
jgi:hypothetical protein